MVPRVATLVVILAILASVECATIKQLETLNIDASKLHRAHEDHKRARRSGNTEHAITLDLTPDLKVTLVHQLPNFAKRFIAEARTPQGIVPIQIDRDIWYHGSVEGEAIGTAFSSPETTNRSGCREARCVFSLVFFVRHFSILLESSRHPTRIGQLYCQHPSAVRFIQSR